MIRLAKKEEINDILKIYDIARNIMRNNGNMNQWINGYPSRELLLNDIKNNNLYIIKHNKEICAVFAFIIGIESTYLNIEGKWLSNNKYGTIHRIGSNGKYKNIFKECLNYCENIINDIRIDTHEDNKIMQHIVSKNGFRKCGIVTINDGSVRIAYEKLLKDDIIYL